MKQAHTRHWGNHNERHMFSSCSMRTEAVSAVLTATFTANSTIIGSVRTL